MAQPTENQIIIDQKPLKWTEETISGQQILSHAEVDSVAYDAWMEIPGQDDKPIGIDEAIDLTQPGTERFFTAKKKTTEGQNDISP